MEKIGFFEESAGVKSSTRLFAFIILMLWVAICLYQVFVLGDFKSFEFHMLILTAAFAPKSISKFTEQSNELKKELKELKQE